MHEAQSAADTRSAPAGGAPEPADNRSDSESRPSNIQTRHNHGTRLDNRPDPRDHRPDPLDHQLNIPDDRLILESDLADMAIHEANTTPAGGHVVAVTLIRAGTSANGKVYPDAVLRQAAPLFEGAKAFADHQDAGRAGQPRSVRDLVGHYRNVRFEPSANGGRIRADLHLIPGNEWLWSIIQESKSAPDICGLSIDALGTVQPGDVAGRRCLIVENIRKVNSVDIVSRPAAGGSLDRILASVGSTGRDDDDRPAPSPESDMDERARSFRTDAAMFGKAGRVTANLSEATLSDDERRAYATVIRHHADAPSEYLFPIPPAGHPGALEHARLALARLDQSDLEPQEKHAVETAARRVIAANHHTQEDDRMTADSPPAAPDSTLVEEEAASTVTLTEQLRRLQEERDIQARELSQIKAALAAGPAPADPNASATQLLEQIKQERDQEKCARLLESALAAAHLPTAIENRLRKRYAGRVFTEIQLGEDIAEEREVLGALTNTGLVTGHGAEKIIATGLNEYEQIQAAFDRLFDIQESEQTRAIPRLDGIRSAFKAATGRDITAIGGVDAPILEAYNHGLRNYVRHAVENGTLREEESHLAYLLETDVTTSTFSYLLGTSMNKRLLKDYQAWPSEWQKFTNTVAIKDFKQQDRIRLGAFGSLSQVAEDAAYTTLTLSDTHATYTPAKYGNLVQISRETIINDDLYAIKQIPQKLAVAAAFSLAEFVYGLLDPNGANIYDGYKLFSTSHHGNTGIASGNIGTANSGSALASASMQTGTIAMRKQANAAGKPIGLKPRFLLVPPDLEFNAMTILKSAGLPGGSNNDINPMMGYCEPIVAPQCNSFAVLGATATFACLVADPRVIDTVEIGFVGGQVNPGLFVQDQPMYGLNFTQDVISYKVRHEYGGAVVDYRGFYLLNN